MRAYSQLPLHSYRCLARWCTPLFVLLGFSLACADAQANTFTVTTLNDSGAGSLRQAILGSNANAGAGIIVFADGLTGTIALTSALPNIAEDVTLSGPGAKRLVVARSSGTFRILTIDAGAATAPTVHISGLTLANGLLQEPVPTDYTVQAYYGGGVLNNNATVTFTDCAITGNSIAAPVVPPGSNIIYFPYLHGFGGGLYNNGGTMTLTRCTISNNSVSSNASGGGLGNNAGTLNLINCTISGNQASFDGPYFTLGTGGGPYIPPNFAYGGGIWNTGTLNMAACTLANNSAFNNLRAPYYPYNTQYLPGKGSSVYNAGTVTLYQTILANGNANGTVNVVSEANNSLISLGYNLSSDASGPNDGATDRLSVDAKLRTLADYGGPTPTHLPLPGSPVLDAGDPNFNSNPATDQRGQARVFNGRVDIGAVERQAVEATADDDAYSVKHDHTLRVAAPGVLANDTGAAPLVPVLITQPANGTLILDTSGSFIYTSNAGYAVTSNGKDSFAYRVQDSNGRVSNVATVTITIISDNAPVLTNSLSATAPVGKVWNFTATATDADLPDDALTYSLYIAPSGSLLPPGMTINSATGVIAWTPQMEGVFRFGIIVTDRYGRSDQQTFTLTVSDSPPVLTNVLTGTATAGKVWNFTATATDPDLPDDTLTFALVNAPAGMTINAATGAIAWKSQVEGTTTFGIKVTDKYGKSDQKTFTLTVQSDPNGYVSLSITNVVLQRSNANVVTVSFNVVNSGTGKATNLVITRATLGGWLSVVNSAPVSVGAGGRQAYTLTFSGVAPLPKVVYPLQIRGTYQAQNVAQSLFYGGGVIVP